MGFDVNNNQLIAAINRDLIIFHRNWIFLNNYLLKKKNVREHRKCRERLL